jgi:O-methyltransferase involved in polyketide biosynthesis
VVVYAIVFYLAKATFQREEILTKWKRGQRRVMMDLSQVSRTAILLLICRAIEAEKKESAFIDPMAGLCLERLMRIATEEDRRWIIRRKRAYGE